MVKEIYLVRHGQTFANLDISKPKELTPLGKKQAKKTAQFLKKKSFDVMYSSTMNRAKDTAAIISKFHKKVPIALDIFNEINGNIVGCPWDEGSSVIKNYKGKKRAKGAYTFLTHSSYDRILLVSHANITRTLLTQILGVSFKKGRHLQIKNCSVIKISFDMGYPRFRTIFEPGNSL
ncbi:MAG: histidine phosphatase family protein [Candidatus Woesearchaeota archaeon]